MGGAGDLDLLFQAIRRSKARRVIETGVAYGWSSLAALSALRETDGRLASVDMPYPKEPSEAFVGVAVPAELRDRWTLIREPDRNGLRKAIRAFGGVIDLCHYDSDKSYPGRMFAYPLLWKALRPGGVFISDDVQDNFAFRDFCAEHRIRFALTESDGKFVGIARKVP
jgi:predicted O-methyltransferase YrrM